MTTPTLRLLTALILSCLAFLSSARSQTIANQKVATGTVSGRVTLRGKGVPGIAVALRKAESDQRRPALTGTTDPEGNYRISKVPAGQYQAAPVAPTFVIPEMTRSAHEGKLVVLTEGENVVGIDFTLVKAGVITGKVSDAEGRPVVEERLNLIGVGSIGSNRDVRSRMLDFRTDDRGVYRIFGLPAGRYKVSVGQDGQMGTLGSGRGRRPYRLTYHPDAADSSQAAIVEVVEGGETSDIDITVGRILDGYAARGRIIDGETGQPLANIRLGVTPRMENRDYGYPGVRSLSSSRGEFTIEGLTPGRYSIVVAPQEGNDTFADPVLFEVFDRDVDNLIIKTSQGATLTGVVVLEGSNDKALLARLYRLRLNVWVQGGPPGFPTWRSTAINPDGSFRLTALQAGVANVNTLSSPDYEPAKDFVVLYAEREGVRMTQGIELKAREEISGLRVVVASGTGVIRGEVIFANGTATPDSRLGALITKAGESVPLRAAEVDARGHFAIEGLPAGTYSLQVRGYIPGARNQSATQQVNVVDGVVTEITITLDLNPVPGSKP
jgi:hypothetical protein